MSEHVHRDKQNLINAIPWYKYEKEIYKRDGHLEGFQSSQLRLARNQG